MKHVGLLGALALVACGSNPSVIPAGDFSGPSGLAVVPLPDRDLLFIANQGTDELRAMTLCTAPAGTSSSCQNEDLQFLPAPVRLFAGSIVQVGERPLRLAGAPLLTADSSPQPHGAVLVVGSDPALHLVDAANVFAASRKTARAQAPKILPLPDLPVDVVASDVPGTSVTAVVATQAGTGVPAALTVLQVAIAASGLAEATATQQCAIDFVPTRLALVPGTGGLVSDTDRRPRFVYVADGTPDGTPGGIGDGAVEVSVPAIPVISSGAAAIPACPVTRRLPASDPADSPRRARPLRSLALSPAFFNQPPPAGDAQPVAAGALLIGATAEDRALCANHDLGACPASLGIPAGAICVDHGFRSCGRGRVILLNTNVGGQSQVLRAPPLTDPAVPMVPLSPKSPTREVAFIARDSCPPAAPQECTAIRLLSSTPVVQHPAIIGLASTEDGTTAFIDVRNRRFFSDARDTATPTAAPQFGAITLTPGPPSGVPSTNFTLAPTDTSSFSKRFLGWINPGVSRSIQWRVVWHGAMPGLESLNGRFSRAAGSPTVSFTPARSLGPWTSSPELRLGAPLPCTLHSPDCVGDFVRVLSSSSTCAGVTAPGSIDVPIAAIAPDGLTMQLLAVPGFDPGPECFASAALGGTVEVHAGASTAGPWMVFEGLDVLSRMPHDAQFVVTGPRFDYPVPLILPIPPDVSPPPPPPPARDIVLSFTISGAEPTVAGAFISVPFDDAQTITGIRDSSSIGLAGFAGPMVVYTSPVRPDPVVFTALAGSNSLILSVPAQFGLANSVRFIY